MSAATTAPPARSAIVTEGVVKTYSGAGGPVEAVRGISLDIAAGEAFGLLGPNGAGKSTTLGMLTTRVRPTAGRAEVAGCDVVRDPVGVKRRIGVVSQHNTLDRQLSALENLEFRGRYSGATTADARRRGRSLLERFGLGDMCDRPVQHMSGGQAQRVMIARALMNEPDVLFLDEPTSGLDPQTRVNLWDDLREMNAQGQTIVLTTHYLEEAEQLCRRIAVVDAGEVLACDTRDALARRYGGDSVITLGCDDPAGGAAPPGTLNQLAEQVAAVRGVSGADASGAELRVRTPEPRALIATVIRTVLDRGLAVVDVSIAQPSLETVFLTLTGRAYRT